jgi:hypothetical protein
MLYPQKNLLRGFKDFINNIMDVSNIQDWSMDVGSKLGNGYWLVDVKPNTVYTFSIGKDDLGIKLAPFNKDASVNISPYTTDNYVTFNTGNNFQVRLYISRASGSASTVKNVMFNEGAYQPFEPYELGMKQYVGLPEKNLVSDFNSSQWFEDSTTPGGTLTVDADNPYRATITTTTSAQGRLIQIPVELGKTYTLSFRKIQGLLRVYKDRVTFHDNPKNIFQGSTAVPVTFTVDETFNRAITIRLTLGSAGTVRVEDLQLEEGVATQFEPMSLTKLKESKNPTDKVFSDMSGAATHPYGNIGDLFSVKKDVYVKDCTIQVFSAGTFNVAIYEWVQDVGAVGLPIYRKENNLSVGVQTYSFGGVLLRAGKTYWIGRLDEGSLAGVGRSLGVDLRSWTNVDTLGGTRLTDTSISFQTTFYYFYGLEFEAVDLKKAKGVPSVNLVNPDVSKWVQGSADSSGNLTGGSTRLVLVERVKMSPNTKYTVKVNNGYRMFMRNFSDQSVEISNSGWVTDGYTFTTPMNIKTVLVLIARGDDTGINVSEVSKASPMLAQGEWDRNLPYEEVMKPAILYPKKNLIQPYAQWKTASPNIKETDNNYYFVLNAPTLYYGQPLTLPVKALTKYSLSAEGSGRLSMIYYDAANNQLGRKTATGTSVTDTTPVGTAKMQCYFEIVSLNTDAVFKNVQLEEGDPTPFEPYELTTMKPN